MAYVLTALIARSELLRGAREPTVVTLPQGMGLVPLVRKGRAGQIAQPLLRGWEGRHAPDADFESPEERQRCIDSATAAFDEIATRCARISFAPGGAVAYVEAEYWAGSGNQAAFVWVEGEPVLGPIVADDAINRALARIGVEPGFAGDPFSGLDLGRFRSNEDWLALAEGRS